MEFVASLVKSLAWPVAVAAVAVLLRAELAGLLRRLERVRRGDTEATFGREIDEVADQVAGQVAALPPSEQAPPVSTATTIAETLIDVPHAAIVVAWSMLERELRERAAAAGIERAARAPIGRLVDELTERGVVDEDDRPLIARLSRLRNEAAHGVATPTASESLKFASSVDYLLSRLPLT